MDISNSEDLEFNLFNLTDSHGLDGIDTAHLDKEASEQKSKKNRRTKKDISNKKFLCNICSKAYYSYPALYTHKRNKHNVIPITGKQTIFKKSKNSYKFKYNALESSNKNKELRDALLKTYREKLISFFLDPECILYDKDFNPDANLGLVKLESFTNHSQIKIKEILKNATIDDALTIYLSSFVEVTRKDFFIDILTTYCILLRTYLNTIGWDYKRKFIETGVNIEFRRYGAFTAFNDCKEVPDLINEFLSVFMTLDEKFFMEEKYILDITTNFCSWLFVNNLTNFKLIPNEDPSIEGYI
jgi:hypothetical protein